MGSGKESARGVESGGLSVRRPLAEQQRPPGPWDLSCLFSANIVSRDFPKQQIFFANPEFLVTVL